MTPDALARLHAAAFTDGPAPWTARSFLELLSEPAVFLAAESGGFALGRRAGPEAELLTLAVHPDARRRGIGRRLVRAFEAAAGSEEAFLEVAETNVAARALYAGLGYAPVGRRPGYYHRPPAPPLDALVMRKRLEPGAESN